jgi:hypothetical protein
MKLYICWMTNQTPRRGGHPCANAYEALKEAGHHPEIQKSYGWTVLPEFMNRTKGRQEVKKLTGKLDVPVLVLDDGEVVAGSREIVEWAGAHPAKAAA